MTFVLMSCIMHSYFALGLFYLLVHNRLAEFA